MKSWCSRCKGWIVWHSEYVFIAFLHLWRLACSSLPARALPFNCRCKYSTCWSEAVDQVYSESSAKSGLVVTLRCNLRFFAIWDLSGLNHVFLRSGDLLHSPTWSDQIPLIRLRSGIVNGNLIGNVWVWSWILGQWVDSDFTSYYILYAMHLFLHLIFFHNPSGGCVRSVSFWCEWSEPWHLRWTCSGMSNDVSRWCQHKAHLANCVELSLSTQSQIPILSLQVAIDLSRRAAWSLWVNTDFREVVIALILDASSCRSCLLANISTCIRPEGSLFESTIRLSKKILVLDVIYAAVQYNIYVHHFSCFEIVILLIPSTSGDILL